MNPTSGRAPAAVPRHRWSIERIRGRWNAGYVRDARKLTSTPQNGAPYILSLTAGVAEADPRSNGFTVVAKTEFANLDDMKYYDNECKAHQDLKAAAKGLTIEGIQTVYFTPQVVAEKQ